MEFQPVMAAVRVHTLRAWLVFLVAATFGAPAHSQAMPQPDTAFTFACPDGAARLPYTGRAEPEGEEWRAPVRLFTGLATGAALGVASVAYYDHGTECRGNPANGEMCEDVITGEKILLIYFAFWVPAYALGNALGMSLVDHLGNSRDSFVAVLLGSFLGSPLPLFGSPIGANIAAAHTRTYKYKCVASNPDPIWHWSPPSFSLGEDRGKLRLDVHALNLGF